MSGAGDMTGVGDFDFFVGSWDGVQRRLAKPLAGCREWDEFGSTTQCFRLFDGAANMDELAVPDRGFKGVTLRLFDPARAEWSIYWGEQPQRPAGAAAGRRPLRRRRRAVLLGRDLPRHQHHGPLSVVGYHAGLGPVGAGVLGRRQEHLGDQLDRGLHPPGRLTRFRGNASGRRHARTGRIVAGE
jgi:hypothetical protein